MDEQYLEVPLPLQCKDQEVPNADSGTDAEPLEQKPSRNSGESNIVKEKHDELVKQGLFTKSHSEGLVKEKTKVITDLKLKEEKDIDKMISMENQLKFLNEIVYKRSQSIQTIHIDSPMTNQSLANRLIPDREEILTLEEESRSKLNKDLVKPFDYTKLNKIVDQAWVKHSNDRLHLQNPTAQDMEILIKMCLMPLALKMQNDSFAFVYELKQEMHADVKIVPTSILFIVDSGMHKAQTGNLSRAVQFLKYHDKPGLLLEGLNHNLFSVGQFCDADLEVAFGNLFVSLEISGNYLTNRDNRELNSIQFIFKKPTLHHSNRVSWLKPHQLKHWCMASKTFSSHSTTSTSFKERCL
ncbi:hypothetical protein Tco_0824120 [Tanacetum coccineum]|uniref:Uncharacterized protein n=1 Tax=Tanacetum coccineum TaxID=301880 RepID=A0ABQ5AKW0_9ASTR